MTLQGLTPMLRTADLKGTVAFYRDVLGFDCEALSEEWGWARLTRDDVEIMLATPHDHEPFDKPGFTGSLYLYSDDVDAAWKELKDTARVCYPIETFDYGMREFAIYDNNGYLLQFGQPVS
ncbi:MAG: VOC family protein [Acidobacteriota bacterium]|nr:VOC family protein [Acidobacteriota bacterium]